MKKLFPVESQKTGGVYRLSANDVQDFYDEHVLGYAGRFKLSALSKFKNVLIDILRRKGEIQAFEGLVCCGTVLLRLFGSDGELIDVRAGANLVVNTGKDAVIDRLQAASVAVHDYQAIGTGTNAAAAGDTTLQTEVARAQGTLSQPTSTTDRLVTTFAAGTGTGAITECGRLNAASTGNLFARQVFSVVTKGAGDSLTVTHDITIS